MKIMTRKNLLKKLRNRSSPFTRLDIECYDFHDCDLTDLDLSNITFYYCNFSYCDLTTCRFMNDVHFNSCRLTCCNLNKNFRGISFLCCSLDEANLKGLDVSSIHSCSLLKTKFSKSDLPEGDLIGYKKLSEGKIAKLLIPASSLRFGRSNEKSRAQYAIVQQIYIPKGLYGNSRKKVFKTGFSIYNSLFCYKTGEVVFPDWFDPVPQIECSGGIHFFLTEKEAIAY